MNRTELIEYLLADPKRLKQKKPFTRGADRDSLVSEAKTPVGLGLTTEATLPKFKHRVVTQEQFMRELDPNCHNVLFDDNIPSICVKVKDGSYYDIEYVKMAIPFQRNIKDKQVMHLTAHPMQFTLVDTDPNELQQENFIVFKQYWALRNQDGMKTKMVDVQKSYGDAGLLYYFDYNGEIKSRILSFADGYVLCPHNDQNGDRVLESVYYVKDDVEYIDSYDDTYMYRYSNDGTVIDPNDPLAGWAIEPPVKHGFSEIPLITKRGKVAWDNVQPIIDSYEELYNVFNAIQKRWGWGILYIKGKFKDTAQKLAGSVVLNDTSIDGSGDAKFLTPPSPEGTLDTLDQMFKSIQLGASTTFLLPEDVKTSGDISGVAIFLTQSMDIENASLSVIEWQNVADKMARLFKEGLAKELVSKGINPRAITEFEQLHINSSFKVWRPMNEYEFNQMLTLLTGAGILSKESGIELSTVSRPDEKARVQREQEAQTAAMEAVATAQQAQLTATQQAINEAGEE